MSYLSKLVEGKMSPQDFVAKSADELKRDLRFLAAFPGALDWALNGLSAVAISAGVSPTLAAVLISGIKALLTPAPAAATPAPATPPSPPG